ncbi:tRNA lysidine(34) synthetase TilS [Bacillus sp. FJAT-27225]|uniref:tRNA lysidine(34) synthetase TilS n=1 Tax=Bacillus sp. FJAT-27225 TaxID=1743144 RepID=UPI00080C24A0|nr:tRNA lysidine(34) synthetase TilS [Bacillus sp. FJAT-27225]OCA80690.1 tRNA lysidine(34) synthetase TilS [Bacillus sp. FJAT-27225]
MLEEKIESLLKRNNVSLVGKSVLVGVSGGPDSMALFHYLWEQAGKIGINIAAAHVDHMFRGEQSLEDAMYVERYCNEKGIPFHMARINVPGIISSTGKNGQEAARDARYGFFQELIEEYRYSYLALGHHGDDQVETILMRLTRGSSGRGRAGIPFRRPFHGAAIIRPLLGATRGDIIDFCERKGIKPRFDPSNEKDVYSRNRFRKTILPFLKRENPHVHEHFLRFSEDIERDEAFLEELAVQRMDTVMTSRENDRVVIDILAFLGMPMPLQRRGIQLILNYLYEGKPAYFAALHIDQAISLIKHPHPSGKLDLPGGLKITRSYNRCIFHFEKLDIAPFRFELDGPGAVKLPNEFILSAEVCANFESGLGNDILFLPFSQVQFPLIIRTREKGDRMPIKGMEGTKKLKDIFIDCKVPVANRGSWPVITDSSGRIIWLPGLKKTPLDTAGEPGECYLKLMYKKESTSGGHI